MLGRTDPSRQVLAVGLVAAMVALAGCSAGDGGERPSPGDAGPAGSGQASPAGFGQPSPAGSGQPSPAGSGGAVQSFPIPASAEASPLPGLGTRQAGDLTFTLNAVRRVSPESVVVEGTLTAASNTVLSDLAEPGFAVRAVGGERPSTYEISAVSLSVPADPKVYLPLRDEKGFCACTQGIQSLASGQSMGTYTYVTAPAGARAVTITLAKFASFPTVPVTQ